MQRAIACDAALLSCGTLGDEERSWMLVLRR
jgi:hypothetical protein